MSQDSKNIVIGMCGGIAAFKIVDVILALKNLGTNVDIIMTKNATEFITPLTLQTISQNPVVCDMFEKIKEWKPNHISLARKADLITVAPATANIIGKVASGIADDLLTTTIIATKAPVLFVPAMNDYMYENPIVQSNITKLMSFGYHFLEPETGRLACGPIGKGKLPEPESIVANMQILLSSEDPKK